MTRHYGAEATNALLPGKASKHQVTSNRTPNRHRWSGRAVSYTHLLRTDINQALNRLPQVEGTGGDVQPSQDLVRVLNLCDKLAQKRGDNFISSELFVLAALESRGKMCIRDSAGAGR